MLVFKTTLQAEHEINFIFLLFIHSYNTHLVLILREKSKIT